MNAEVIVIEFFREHLENTIRIAIFQNSYNQLTISIIDAFFTAVSETTVTGLAVVDTGTTFTLFGQIIIMLIIQIGGLGLLTLAVMVILLLGKKIRFRERLLV